MTKKDIENCWEYWKCEKKIKNNCPAYTTKSGRNCWVVAGSLNTDPKCPKIKNEFEFCLECPWFKKLNPKFFEK